MLRLAGPLVCVIALTGCSYLGLGGGSDAPEPEPVAEAPARADDAVAKVDGRVSAVERNQDILNKRTQEMQATLSDLRSQMEGIRGEIALARSSGPGVVPLTSTKFERPEPKVDVDSRVVELLTRLKKDGKRDSVVTGVAQEVCALGPEGVEKFVGAMRDRDPNTAQAIQRVLEQTNPAVSLGAIKKGLSDPAIRLRCIQIMGEMKDDSVVPDLVQFMDDPNLDVRFYAADCLVKMEYKEAIPILIEALSGTEESHCAIAFRTLSDVTGQTFGYRFYDATEKREASARLWNAWWKAEGKHFEFGH